MRKAFESKSDIIKRVCDDMGIEIVTLEIEIKGSDEMTNKEIADEISECDFLIDESRSVISMAEGNKKAYQAVLNYRRAIKY